MDAVHESVVVTDEHDRPWTRTVVQATQVQVAEQPQAVARVVEGA